MEFLIVLENKTTPSCFCLNCGDLDKNKKSFKDITFSSPCPYCGKSDKIYRKENLIAKRGHILTYKPDGWSWGRNELKHFAVIRVPDITEEEAQNLIATKGERNITDLSTFIDFKIRDKKIDIDNIVSQDIKDKWDNIDLEVQSIDLSKEIFNNNLSQGI